ncbi:hypothetical protein EMCRGX_G022646 [Ephydatia muelleri]|eukprot:Em0017g972a
MQTQRRKDNGKKKLAENSEKMSDCSMDISENISAQSYNSSNLTYALLIVVPTVHIAISIIELYLGGHIIYFVYQKWTLRDSVSALIVSVTVLLMALSIPTNLLAAVSIMTDLPLLGACDNSSRYLIDILVIFQWDFVAFSVGLIATVQFLVIKYGKKRVTLVKVLLVLTALAFLAMMFSISGNISAEVGCVRVTKIRGSICAIAYGHYGPAVVVWIFLGYVVPGIVTMVMSYMTNRTVRTSVIEMDNDHSVIKSVLVMSIVTIITAFALRIPLNALFIWAINTGNHNAYLLMSPLSAVEPLFILLLFTTLHKSLRLAMAAAIKTYFKCLARPEEPDV